MNMKERVCLCVFDTLCNSLNRSKGDDLDVYPGPENYKCEQVQCVGHQTQRVASQFTLS